MYDAQRNVRSQPFSLRTFKRLAPTFRTLTAHDALELSYLELEIFPSPWSEASLRDCLELATVQGEAALWEGKIIGYLIAQCVLDEAHILSVGVRPIYRRLGIAKLLLERFLERGRAQRLSNYFLEVRVNNRAAQQLYYTHGFAPVALRRRYYPDGEDALILMKKL